jgi:hypothetical protein
MILTDNIKNKIFLYIAEKRCPVCKKKINKFCNNKHCSFLCFVKFQIGLMEFIISFFYFFLMMLISFYHFNILVYVFLSVIIILILFDICKVII